MQHRKECARGASSGSSYIIRWGVCVCIRVCVCQCVCTRACVDVSKLDPILLPPPPTPKSKSYIFLFVHTIYIYCWTSSGFEVSVTSWLFKDCFPLSSGLMCVYCIYIYVCLCFVVESW